MKRVTIKDVARAANVSEATVSLCLNNKAGVSDVVRRRVLRTAKSLNYQPNELARNLTTQKTKTLGIVVKDVSNPFYSQVTRAIETAAYDKGYSILLVSTNERHDKEVEAVELLRRQQVAGLIIVPVQRAVDLSHIEALNDAGYPYVLISPPIPGLDADYVYNDDFGGAAAATKHLIERGYRKIGFAYGPTTSSSGWARLQGYQATMREAGIDVRPEWLVPTGATIESGTALAASLPERLLDALLCYNDLVAIGVMLEMTRKGFEIPRDLALVGFDNIEVTEVLNPPLTTVQIPRYEIGQRAIETLFERIENPGKECLSHVLPTRLCVRRST